MKFRLALAGLATAATIGVIAAPVTTTSAPAVTQETVLGQPVAEAEAGRIRNIHNKSSVAVWTWGRYGSNDNYGYTLNPGSSTQTWGYEPRAFYVGSCYKAYWYSNVTGNGTTGSHGTKFLRESGEHITITRISRVC